MTALKAQYALILASHSGVGIKLLEGEDTIGLIFVKVKSVCLSPILLLAKTLISGSI